MVDSYGVTRNLPAAMRDGVILRADVWRPAGSRPVPAILFRTAYDKRTLNPDFLRPQQCVEAGFAAVVQDTRGRFASDGDWRPAMWEQEGLDTFDTVEWVAAQDWCSGAVGMSGPSYLGIVQLAGAALRPPHLKAIAPAMATTSKFEQIETGGAFRLDQVISWIAFMGIDWLKRRQANGLTVTEEQTAIVMRSIQDPCWLMSHRPLREIPLFSLPDFPVSFEELVGDRASAAINLAAIEIPTFNVGGWYDVFSRASVGMFLDQSDAARAPSHLLMGCWTHAGHLPQQHGQMNFGVFAGAGAAGIAERHLQFFRRYLAGEEVAVPAVRYFLMNANEWRDCATWPPQGLETRRFYLRGGLPASLTTAMPAEQPPSAYAYDPADPTPTFGGRVLYVGGLATGPLDQTPLHRRRDVLVFIGEPVGALDLVGPVSARLCVSSSALDTDFVVKLLDISPEGQAMPIVEGALRMRWRTGFEAECLMTPDAVETVTISLGDTAWRVAAGHRIALQVQSANYPHLDPNMNTGAAIGTEALGNVAHNQIFHDAAHPSWVEFAVTSVARIDGRK